MADEEDFNEEDVQNYVDESEDEFDDNNDLRESQMDSYGGSTYPEQSPKNDLYTWFWKIVNTTKPFHLIKVANLNSQEIGPHNISVRDAMNLWVLGHTFHHSTFGNYFAQNAKIVSATSMSKKGWFMDLSISQKKVRERQRQSGGEESWRIYKKKNNIE